MEIIYCHHAERERIKNRPLQDCQDEDITALGKKDAQNFADSLNKHGRKITAVYTSVFKRCKTTADIVNQYSNAPIFEEPRFNEFVSTSGETWTEFQKRNIDAIKDIIAKHNNDDVILCVASGVNIGAFICWSYGIEPSEKTPFLWVNGCSPITFRVDK